MQSIRYIIRKKQHNKICQKYTTESMRLSPFDTPSCYSLKKKLKKRRQRTQTQLFNAKTTEMQDSIPSAFFRKAKIAYAVLEWLYCTLSSACMCLCVCLKVVIDLQFLTCSKFKFFHSLALSQKGEVDRKNRGKKIKKRERDWLRR